ncbi:uncharacterized protein Dwil_GK17326, partial [Drosophila willistoni]
MQNTTMQSIKLKTLDNITFDVSPATVKCSSTIQEMLLECEVENGAAIISLPDVHSTTLAKILIWAEHHKDEPVPVRREEMGDNTLTLSPWDIEYFKMDLTLLFDLMNAAENLDIEGIVHGSCKTVADLIKGKTTAEMREIFNIRCDLPGPNDYNNNNN